MRSLTSPLAIALFYGGLFKSLLAIDFDGVNDLVAVGSPAALTNIWDTGGTLSAWVFPRSDGESDGGHIIDKNGSVSGWILHVVGEAAGEVQARFYIDFDGGTDGGWITTATEIPIDAWTHIVLTYDGSNVTNNAVIYINGTALTVGAGLTKFKTPVGDPVDDSGSELNIGNNSVAGGTWDGVIDDTFILNRIMTAAEVSEAYNNGQPIDLRKSSFWSDVLAWWKMGDGDTYPTITDNKGSNDGTMTNMSADDIVAGVNG